MKLKLLVDSKSSKVLFAEADKEFVDFLFSIFALPLGTVIKLLKQNDDGMVGSLGVLYSSVERLGDSYIMPELTKEDILSPKVILPFGNKNVPLLECASVSYAATAKKLYTCRCQPSNSSSHGNPGSGYSQGNSFNLSDSPRGFNRSSNSNPAFGFSPCKSFKLSNSPQTRCPSCTNAMTFELTFFNPSASAGYADTKLYTCSKICKYITENPNNHCPSCQNRMNNEITYVNAPSASTEKGGYVKGVVTYMVMDDLDVKPLSTISSIALLNTFNVTDVGVLKEENVSIGMAEGLKLLRASLHSKTVLTDVFLSKTKE